MPDAIREYFSRFSLFLLKAFEVGFASNLREIEQRPSRGTTVSVYGFREVPPLKKWDVSTICFLIAAVAVTELEVPTQFDRGDYQFGQFVS